MFKNPLKKYAAGGVTSSQEQVLVEKFSKAASKLNIDTEVLIQKVQELTKEQQIDFMKAIQDIADKDNPSPESIQFIQSVFAKSSQTFKEGGKIHDFICKHSKGGVAGCGCAKKGENGMVVEEPEGYTWGQYNRNDFLESGPDHEGWVKVETPDGRIGYAKNYRRRFLGIPSRNLNQVLVTPGFNGKMRSSTRNLNGFFGNGQIDTVRNTYDGSTVTKDFANSMDYALEGVAPERKQEGGELSRRQAFKLARENRGYKPGSGQTAFAYANAKDALRREGVRGSALRQQARQMIAGRNYSDTAIPSSMPLLTQNFVAYQNNPTNLVGNRPSDAISGLNKMSFNNAFRTALNNGKTVFVWKGKPYTTELAQTTPVQNKTTLDINSLPEDVRNNLTGNVTVEIPEIEEPNLPNEYLALQPNTFEKELYRQQLNRLFRRNNPVLPASGIVYKNGGKIK